VNLLEDASLNARKDATELTELVYTADSELRRPVQMLRSMYLDLLRSRGLAWRLFLRDLNGQYRQSLLGYLWLLLPPLVSMAIWVFLQSTNVVQFEKTNTPYPVFVLTGLVLWEAFVAALTAPLAVVEGAAPMLAKINFPREALLLSAFAQAMFQTGVRLLLLAAILLYFQTSIGTGILMVPFGILSLMLLGFVVGILLIPLAMLYGDVGRTLQMITPVWFFITPAVYPAPSTWPANVLTWANPVSPLLITTRQWLTDEPITHAWSFAVVFLCTLGFLVVGWIAYRVAMPHVIARLSA